MPDFVPQPPAAEPEVSFDVDPGEPAFDKLEGAGTVRIAVPQPELAKRILDLSATLMGRDPAAENIPPVA